MTGTEDKGGRRTDYEGMTRVRMGVRMGGDDSTTTTVPPTAAVSNCSQGGKGVQQASYDREEGVTTMMGTRTTRGQ